MATPPSPLQLTYLRLDSSAPRPEKSTDRYTDLKISERLQYVNKSKARKVSPRTLKFLNLYHQQLESALMLHDEKQKLEACRILIIYDEFIQESTFITGQPTPAQLELQEKTLLLRKFEYYSRYRDY